MASCGRCPPEDVAHQVRKSALRTLLKREIPLQTLLTTGARAAPETLRKGTERVQALVDEINRG